MNLKADVSRPILTQYNTGQVLEVLLYGTPLLSLWAVSFTVLLGFFFNQLKLLITIKNVCENFSYHKMEIAGKLF